MFSANRRRFVILGAATLHVPVTGWRNAHRPRTARIPLMTQFRRSPCTSGCVRSARTPGRISRLNRFSAALAPWSRAVPSARFAGIANCVIGEPRSWEGFCSRTSTRASRRPWTAPRARDGGGEARGCHLKKFRSLHRAPPCRCPPATPTRIARSTAIRPAMDPSACNPSLVPRRRRGRPRDDGDGAECTSNLQIWQETKSPPPAGRRGRFSIRVRVTSTPARASGGGGAGSP